ncbi:LIC12162 family protein [Vibrio sp. YMD68]|uniref:LIC12162 family transferase n=1 Tax=Vibrio sp. YMD68 TaxID=3042300 RepID=UPI00249CBAEB|nr:LIC12162 family protein [Vibrio sp. YMD68]WGW00507.1 LIC12162 family protein [Vibrio sp. YMD68]
MTELTLVTSRSMDLTLDDSEHRVYLGLWGLKDISKVTTHSIVSAPWVDENVRRKDYEKIQQLYLDIFPHLASHLNRVHKTQHSDDFWKIVIGSWTQLAISVFYQRFDLVNRALNEHELTKAIVFDPEYIFEPATHYNEFCSYIDNQDWNDYVFSKILHRRAEGLSLIESKPVNSAIKINSSKVSKATSFFKSIVAIVNSKVNTYLGYHVFFHNSYFPKKSEFKLARKLGQVPQFVPLNLIPPSVQSNPALRRNGHNDGKSIESILLSLLIEQLPKTYLEAFETVEKHALKYYPHNVKAIFTGVSDICDDHFKVWCAHQKMQGIPLLVSQHGGCYGISELSQVEDFQRKNANVFYTWGWSGSEINNLKAMPAPKLTEGSVDRSPKPSNNILVTLYDIPMYTYWNQSFPVGEKMFEYMEDVQDFLKSTSEEVKSDILLRYYPHDCGWGIRERLNSDIHQYQVDCERSLKKSMSNSKICITTCNSTTFLEFIVSGIPTIAFWSESLFPIREEARQAFEELKSVGIFHESAVKAAEFVSSINQDVDGWWGDVKVQKAREKFCLSFAYTSENWLAEWKSELESVALEDK